MQTNTLPGGISGEYAYRIIQTSDNKYIVAGHSFSSISGDISGINEGIQD